MKKFLFFASTLAGLFLAGSCQREDLAPVEENGVVTFEVSIPQVMTKTVSDDGSAINSLVYDVYYTDASVETAPAADDLTLLYKGRAEVATNGATVISVELMNDKNYVILFWAQRDNTWGFATEGNLLKNGVHFPDSFAANAENIEAFSHVEFLSSKNLAARKKNITLKRPFAQINLGSLLADNFTITPTTSSMVVKNAGASFDLINQVAVGKKDVEFTAATVPGGSLKTDYTHVGMNYIFANGNVEVDYVLNTEAGIAVSNTVSNVPVAANYRTNIIGKLFTSEAGYSITLEGWGDAGADMDVITEGLVKNINGDYEISNENGFAYAINKLFADGGTFYIHPGTYDFTGIYVNPQATKPGAILNVKANAVPVVTRSTPGFEIIGLDVAYLVSEVVEGSQALFSGLVLPESTKLVGTNNGVVAVANCANVETENPAELVGAGSGNLVDVEEMQTPEAIQDALDKGLALIELTSDVNIETKLIVKKSVTIDGKGYKVTYTGSDRAIDVPKESVNANVTIKNLEVVLTSSYCERGINFNVTEGTLCIDNVKVSETGTAATYALNLPSSSNRAMVTVKESYLRGNIALNIWGANVIANVEKSTLISVDNNDGENYSAITINEPAKETVVNVTGGSVIARDQNGEASTSFMVNSINGEVNFSETTEVVGNEFITVALVKYTTTDNYYSCGSLEKALKLNKETKNTTIVLMRDIELTEDWTPLGTTDEPFNGTFDGNNCTISGLKVADTDYAAFIAYSDAGCVIKNLNLDVNIVSTKHAAGVVCIAGDGLTIENVTVSGSVEAPSYAGGLVHNAPNVTIKNSTNNAKVTASRAGGIASWVTSGATIETVVNNGDITGAVGASGIAHGFAGSIKNAINNGNVISNGVEPAAGIAGVQKAASTYEYCYNYGDVLTTADNANASAAGILGQTPGSAATLTYCANYGDITAEQSYAAGIGYGLYANQVTSHYCYNSGAVSGADGAGAITPKPQYGATNIAKYCLNSGEVISANGTVYQASVTNTSCYYYNGSDLLNVTGNTAVTAEDALTVLNGGTDNKFFTTENGKIVVK